MARLPDRFDLWVRQARATADPARQADLVLGALAGLNDWHFLNLGTGSQPRSAEGEVDGVTCLLVFSDADRIEDLMKENGAATRVAVPVISIPVAQAMPWCLERRASGCGGLLVNAGTEAFVLPMEQLDSFYQEWKERDNRQPSGFWIPNMTSEEEDFWQQHGL